MLSRQFVWKWDRSRPPCTGAKWTNTLIGTFQYKWFHILNLRTIGKSSSCLAVDSICEITKRFMQYFN